MLGSFWVFCVRVPAVLPSVPVVNVPLSSVNVVCEVVSSDKHCESVEPQTFPLARETRGVFCGKTRTNEFGETPARAPPATRREATVPTRQQSPPPPPERTKPPSDEIMVEMEDQKYCSSGRESRWELWWTARDTAVLARMVQYPDRSEKHQSGN